MNNADVAQVFAEIADLLEIKGADAFRINSYRRVARTIEDLATDINDIAERKELGKLQGVGKASAAKIQELLDTGNLALREELAREVPETLLQLRDIPGVGPKKIAILWRGRGVSSLSELEEAISAGSLDDLKGFGAKSIQQISKGIKFLRRSAGRTRLGTASAIAELMRNMILEMSGVKRVEYAGSLRRGRETIGDVDLLCIAADPAGTIKQFTELPCVAQVLAAGQTKGSALFEYRPGRSLQIDLRVVPEESFGAAWQ
ncbi:MAG: helix-hairpin-helix domain-containing protein, partial [Planctomycetota bacterium]